MSVRQRVNKRPKDKAHVAATNQTSGNAENTGAESKREQENTKVGRAPGRPIVGYEQAKCADFKLSTLDFQRVGGASLTQASEEV